MLTDVGKKKRGPRALVEYFYNKVNISSAFGVVLILLLLDIIFYFIVKMPNIGQQIIYEIYSSIFVSWFVVGLVVFLLAYFIKSAKQLPKRPLEKILSSLASFRIPTIVYSLVSFLIILLFFPNLITLLQSFLSNPVILTSETFLPALTTINIIGLILLGISTIALFIYGIVMIFVFVETLFETKNFFTKLGLVILFLFIVWFCSWVFGLPF